MINSIDMLHCLWDEIKLEINPADLPMSLIVVML